MPKQSDILKLAECTRSWAELARLKTRSEGHFSADLCGMCAIASAHLHEVLKNAGVKTTIVANYDHVFLMIDDMVLDITATQFGDYPKVLYRRHSELSEFWRRDREFETVQALCQYVWNWPEHQQPMSMWDAEFINDLNDITGDKPPYRVAYMKVRK